MALQNKLIKKIVNLPQVLNFGQDFLGANQYKLAMYREAFVGKSGKLLDFGCSYGNTTTGFLNFNYFGVDVDCDAIEAARKRYAKYTNVHFDCLDILKTDYAEAPFDHILFASTSHHLSDGEFTRILDRLLTYLAPEGSLHFFDIFQQPGKDKLTTRLLTRFDQGQYIRQRDQYEQIFADPKYHIAEKRVIESPDKFIKLWDFLYVRFTK